MQLRTGHCYYQEDRLAIPMIESTGVILLPWSAPVEKCETCKSLIRMLVEKDEGLDLLKNVPLKRQDQVAGQTQSLAVPVFPKATMNAITETTPTMLQHGYTYSFSHGSVKETHPH